MILRPVFGIAMAVLVLVVGLALVGLGMFRQTRTRNLDAARRGLIVALLAFICAGPSLPGEAVRVQSKTEVWFVVDRTGSMAAEDWDGSKPRIEGVKEDISTIVQSMPGARVAVLTWDSDLHTVLPLTTDLSALNSFSETFTQELSESSQGSSPDRPALELAATLTKAKGNNPENIRTLFVFTDGETSNTDFWPGDEPKETDWDQVKPLIDGGLVIGYGTNKGGPMKVRRLGSPQTPTGDSGQSGDENGQSAVAPQAPTPAEEDEYILDLSQPNAPVALSYIDETKLRAIASRIGIPYVHSPDKTEISSVAAGLNDEAQTITDSRDILETYRYFIWPFALVLAGLFAWEGGVLAAKARRMRRSHAI